MSSTVHIPPAVAVLSFRRCRTQRGYRHPDRPAHQDFNHVRRQMNRVHDRGARKRARRVKKSIMSVNVYDETNVLAPLNDATPHSNAKDTLQSSAPLALHLFLIHLQRQVQMLRNQFHTNSINFSRCTPTSQQLFQVSSMTFVINSWAKVKPTIPATMISRIPPLWHCSLTANCYGFLSIKSTKTPSDIILRSRCSTQGISQDDLRLSNAEVLQPSLHCSPNPRSTLSYVRGIGEILQVGVSNSPSLIRLLLFTAEELCGRGPSCNASRPEHRDPGSGNVQPTCS